jgi:DNA-binding PadR family transcriptional regulator
MNERLTTKLVILGILGMLRDKPLHGYEIKKVIEEHMADWTSVAFGSIYFAIDKLSGEGLIEKISVEQEGNRPSRNVYEITEKGRAEFLRLLRQTWSRVERTYFNLDIGLFFISSLPKEEVLSFVKERLAHLEGMRAGLDRHEKAEMRGSSVPPVAGAIFNHTRCHVEAEVAWTKDLLDKIEKGEYS